MDLMSSHTSALNQDDLNDGRGIIPILSNPPTAKSYDIPKPPVVCVFCAASEAKNPAYRDAARALAKVLHKNKATLVYGGGTTGMMGAIGGEMVRLCGTDAVEGVIPEPLQAFERSAPGLTDDRGDFGRVTIVKDMHKRKALLCKMVKEGGPGSGFVALPGGFGTFDELFEMITWNQLGIHNNGVVFYNVDNYFEGMMIQIRRAVEDGLINPDNAKIPVEASNAEEVMEELRKYKLSKSRLPLTWEDFSDQEI